MNHSGTLTFQCNVCETFCKTPAAMLSREEVSFLTCGSTVRMSGKMYALSIALFGREIALPDFIYRKYIEGKVLGDWKGYAKLLSEKLGFINTYYQKEPKLDVTNTKVHVGFLTVAE